MLRIEMTCSEPTHRANAPDLALYTVAHSERSYRQPSFVQDRLDDLSETAKKLGWVYQKHIGGYCCPVCVSRLGLEQGSEPVDGQIKEALLKRAEELQDNRTRVAVGDTSYVDFAALVNEGKGALQIGDALGITRQRAGQIARKLGVTLPRTVRSHENTSRYVLCDRVVVDVTALRDLQKRGLSLAEAAKEMGFNYERTYMLNRRYSIGLSVVKMVT